MLPQQAQLHRYHLNHLLLSLHPPPDLHHLRVLPIKGPKGSNPHTEEATSLAKQTIGVLAVEQDPQQSADLMNCHSEYDLLPPQPPHPYSNPRWLWHRLTIFPNSIGFWMKLWTFSLPDKKIDKNIYVSIPQVLTYFLYITYTTTDF